jgi:hypothetical protein
VIPLLACLARGVNDPQHASFKTKNLLLTRQRNIPKFVFPAKAGIQADTGCWIKSGMTEFAYLIAGLISWDNGDSIGVYRYN